MTSSHLTVGSGDRHVLAVRGWFGSFEAPVALATSIEEFLGRK